MLAAGKVWRHSRTDSVLVLLGLLHGLLLLLLPSVPLIALGVWWNSNTVSHHFLHLPFFRSRSANAAFALYLTLLVGVPQTLWRERHMAHHAGQPVRLQLSRTLIVETLAVLGLWSLLLAVWPTFFVSIYLPGYAIGLFLCYLHGFYEHARGATSHYGRLYNMAFFNDGYHVEHHLNPSAHWTRIGHCTRPKGNSSRWPAVLRWLDTVNLENFERLALRVRVIQRYLLRSHRRAIARLLPPELEIRHVKIVGGGMYPRTALIFRELFPEAVITIVDACKVHLETAQSFLDESVRYEHAHYRHGVEETADMLVVPLSLNGCREDYYRFPPACRVLVHDWLWRPRPGGVIVSILLLKRLNLVLR
jgi:hypothetical protein